MLSRHTEEELKSSLLSSLLLGLSLLLAELTRFVRCKLYFLRQKYVFHGLVG
jgi:hypothetical protein